MSEQTSRFIADTGIDVVSDAEKLLSTGFIEKYLLAELDETGSLSEHCTDTGADFLFSRLDYYDSDCIIASRFVAKILAGKRTELAYWSEDAPAKRLTVHQGLGSLVIGKPGIDGGDTTVFNLDPEVTPEIILPSGRFYTFEANQNTTKPFVVSGLYYEEVDWGDLESYIDPGQKMLQSRDGLVKVPDDFRSRYEQL